LAFTVFDVVRFTSGSFDVLCCMCCVASLVLHLLCCMSCCFGIGNNCLWCRVFHVLFFWHSHHQHTCGFDIHITCTHPHSLTYTHTHASKNQVRTHRQKELYIHSKELCIHSRAQRALNR